MGYDTTSNLVALKLDLSLVCLSGVKLHAHNEAKNSLKSHFNFKQSQEIIILVNQSGRYVLLNEYETSPYFLQIFQINAAFCLIIYLFCKSYEPKCEPEIFLKNQNKKLPNKVNKTILRLHSGSKLLQMRKSTLLCIGNSEENINLSCIYLAVSMLFFSPTEKF